jgi:translation initiation factor IF-3
MSYKKYVYDLEKAKKQKMKDSGALVMKKPKGSPKTR